MEELRAFWPIVVTIFSCLAIISRFFYKWRIEYDLNKAKRESFESTTNSVIHSASVQHAQKQRDVEKAIREVESKNERAIEKIRLQTENAILKNQQETNQRMDKLIDKVDTMSKSVIEMAGNYQHISKTLDEIKGIQSQNAKFREDFYRDQLKKI